jgi:hypothetical protein
MSRHDAFPARAPRAQRAAPRRAGCLLLAGAAWVQMTNPANAAVDLSQYADFGAADLLLTAATIRQTGNDHRAMIDQTAYPGAAGNLALIDQAGDTHVALVTQVGDLNRARVQQSDSRNEAHVTQTGIGNSIDIWQSGVGNWLSGQQVGNGNVANIVQSGESRISFSQIGNNNTVNLMQPSTGAPVVISITGNGVTVTQR